LITALCLGWIGSHLAPARTADESPWQLRELDFLKAAYDRTQQDVAQQHAAGAGEASASLHAEQERILRQMRDAARLLPPETIPEELRALLHGPGWLEVGATAASGFQPIKTREGDRRVPDLRVGWRIVNSGETPPITHSAELAIDPELREPIRAEPANSGPVSRRKPSDDAGREQR
jgi:hypothetical protein